MLNWLENKNCRSKHLRCHGFHGSTNEESVTGQKTWNLIVYSNSGNNLMGIDFYVMSALETYQMATSKIFPRTLQFYMDGLVGCSLHCMTVCLFVCWAIIIITGFFLSICVCLQNPLPKSLDYITWAGCALSITCLAIMLVIFFAQRYENKFFPCKQETNNSCMFDNTTSFVNTV